MSLPNVAMSTTDLSTALAQSQVNTTPAGSGQGGFLKIDFRTGDWTFGRDQEEVTGDTVIVNTSTIGHGWVCWANGKATKQMVPFNHPLPQKMAPIDGNEATEGRIIMGAFLDEDAPMDEATQFTFETNSYGGRKAVDTLLTAIKTKAVSGSKFLFPAVTLDSDSYVNKKHGSKIHNPVFTVVNWYDENGVAEDATAKIGTEAEKAPAAEPEAEAPKRRRRRTAQ